MVKVIPPLQGLTQDTSLRVLELYLQGFKRDAVELYKKWHQAGWLNDHPPKDSWYDSQIISMKKSFE